MQGDMAFLLQDFDMADPENAGLNCAISPMEKQDNGHLGAGYGVIHEDERERSSKWIYQITNT